MIIIEGPDLIGKTTLALALQKELAKRRYTHVYNHFTKLPPAFDRYHGYLPFIHANVVQDRFHLSRQAYGRVFGEQELLSATETRLLDAHIRLVGGFTVVAYARDPDFIRQQYAAKDRDEMFDVDGVVKANAAYTDLLDSLEADVDFIIPVDAGNWPSDNLEAILDLYLARRKEWERVITRAEGRPLRA